MDWKDYCQAENWHEAANLFPLMQGPELDALAEDIKQNGLQHKIVLLGNKVLDGRNRLIACEKAGVKPEFVKWTENGTSPLDFVIAQNVKRRHLTTSQKAALAAKLVPQLEKDAQQRQKAAGKYGAKGGRGHKKAKPSAQDCADGLGKSAAQAALIIGGVSERTVEKVLALQKDDPGILDRIIQEEVTLQEAIRETEKGKAKRAKTGPGSLVDRFIAPPFNVFDPKQEYWKGRQRRWLTVLDPVLCEIIYRWHLQADSGHVLDPFAADSVAGIVAARLGYQYTGIEPRSELVKVHKRQASLVQAMNPGMNLPTWVCGDPAFLDKHLPAKAQYDLIFTTLPQPDLKRLNRARKDNSGIKKYDKLIASYEVVLRQAVCRLKQDRFLVLKFRCTYEDENGWPQSLMRDVTSFLDAGLGIHYYNQLEVMVMSSNCHETLICYWKGDNMKLIPEKLGELKEVKEWPAYPQGWPGAAWGEILKEEGESNGKAKTDEQK